MKIRSLILSIIALSLCLGRPLLAEEAAKTGYKVVVDISIDEAGAPEDARIIESEDFSGDQVLNHIAMLYAKQVKQAPRIKDGKPVKFIVRAPFYFPVEGDEGAAANLAPKPSLHGEKVAQPIYPAELVAKGEVGGAILEVVVNTDGYVKTATVLRASHKEFGESSLAAVKQWVFKPAMKDGGPVESRWRLAMTFAIGDKDVEWQWRIAPRPSLGGFKVVHAKIPPAPAAEAKPADQPAPGK